MTNLHTARLLLRRWRDDDRAPFAALNADPDVMEFMPKLLTRAESDEFVDRIDTCFDERGFGLWAVEPEGEGFVGYVGLWPAEFPAHFTPAIEIGWRLARAAWGHGYATEAARVLAFAFADLGVDEVVSFTATTNVRSQRVMERIGMTRDPAGDFDHPNVASDSPLRPHVLYRIALAELSGKT